MRFLSVILCLLSSAVPFVVGETSYCVTACQNPLTWLKFKATDDGSASGKPQCINQFHIESFYVCLREYCTASQIKTGVSSLTKTCKPSTVPPFSIVNNITSSDLRQVQYNDLRKKTPIAEVVLLSDRLFALSVKTLAVTADQDQINLDYGHVLIGFWGIVIVIGCISRVYTAFALKRRTQASTEDKLSLVKRVKLGVRQHVTTPALFKEHSAQPVGWATLPPRLPSLIILSFIIINVVLMLVSYNVFAENVRRPNQSQQLTRLIARRSGVYAIANLPLMFTFGMRNNVLMWLTGWSFHTFTQFHRWIARMAAVEMVIHGICYSVYEYKTGGLTLYYSMWDDAYWQAGAVALVAACLTTAWAIYPVRRHLYEAFLVMHIIFAVVVLVGTWVHLEDKSPDYLPYFWPCVAVWAFDRFMRLIRIAHLNLFSSKALAKYNPHSGLLRLEVPIRSTMQAQAGTYYYVYVLHGLKFWESHPFTLSSWDSATQDAPSSQVLSFIIQPQDSFTARLRDNLIRQNKAEDGSAVLSSQVRVLVEGPYGRAHSLRSYDTALIIVGGSGSAVATSHLRSLRDSLDKTDKMATRRVHIVWVTRHEEQVKDLMEHEVASWLDPSGLLREVDVKVDVYVTHTGEGKSWAKESSRTELDEKENSDSSASSTSGQEDPTVISDEKIQSSPSPTETADEKSPNQLTISSSVTTSMSNLNHFNYRPSVREIVVENARVYGSRGKRMALVCCGPPSMADEARAAVVTALQGGAEGLDFFPESFSW